jgi:hypothetical protein
LINRESSSINNSYLNSGQTDPEFGEDVSI